MLTDHVAINIREGEVTDVISLHNYTYADYPVVNGRGFEVNVHSNEEVVSFIARYKIKKLMRKKGFQKSG